MTAARKIEPSIAEYRRALASEFMRIRANFEDVCEALEAKVPADEVRERALTVVRPEVRSFLSEVLTRAPLDALERSSGLLHDWSATDSLLEHGGDEMQQLIDAALPEATWTKLKSIPAKKAKREDVWARWSSKWLAEYTAHAEVNPEKGRWARFFSGIEAPEWIVQAVNLAEAVDAHLRKRSGERTAAAEARRPLTYDQVITMKGGTVLRPEDGIAALRGTYQHPDPPLPLVPSPAPPPASPPAPDQAGALPTRAAMITSMGHLAELRDKHLLPPLGAEHVDAFYRWCHDEWTAIKAHAAALEWDPNTKLEPAAAAPSRAEMLAALPPLARLRGRPFILPQGTDPAAFQRWCHHEWMAIKAHAVALEWRPSAPAVDGEASASPSPSPSPAPAPAPSSAPSPGPRETPEENLAAQAPTTLKPSVETRLTTLEDEIRRLRSRVAFLDFNFEQHVKKAEEQNALIQQQLQEIRDLLTQVLGKASIADAPPATDVVPVRDASEAAARGRSEDASSDPAPALAASEAVARDTGEAVPHASSDPAPALAASESVARGTDEAVPHASSDPTPALADDGIDAIHHVLPVSDEAGGVTHDDTTIAHVDARTDAAPTFAGEGPDARADAPLVGDASEALLLARLAADAPTDDASASVEDEDTNDDDDAAVATHMAARLEAEVVDLLREVEAKEARNETAAGANERAQELLRHAEGLKQTLLGARHA